MTTFRSPTRRRYCVVRSGVASRAQIPMPFRSDQIIDASSSNAAAQRSRSCRASALLRWPVACRRPRMPGLIAVVAFHRRASCRQRSPGSGSRQRSSCLAVRWYLRFGLSYRDLEELLAERGIGDVHYDGLEGHCCVVRLGVASLSDHDVRPFRSLTRVRRTLPRSEEGRLGCRCRVRRALLRWRMACRRARMPR